MVEWTMISVGVAAVFAVLAIALFTAFNNGFFATGNSVMSAAENLNNTSTPASH